MGIARARALMALALAALLAIAQAATYTGSVPTVFSQNGSLVLVVTDGAPVTVITVDDSGTITAGPDAIALATAVSATAAGLELDFSSRIAATITTLQAQYSQTTAALQTQYSLAIVAAVSTAVGDLTAYTNAGLSAASATEASAAAAAAATAQALSTQVAATVVSVSGQLSSSTVAFSAQVAASATTLSGELATTATTLSAQVAASAIALSGQLSTTTTSFSTQIAASSQGWSTAASALNTAVSSVAISASTATSATGAAAQATAAAVSAQVAVAAAAITSLSASAAVMASLVRLEGVCAGNGTIYSPSEGQCIFATTKPVCPSSLVVANAAAASCPINSYQSQCGASCLFGYVVSGSPTFTCGINSVWQGSLTCIPASCPANSVGTIGSACTCNAGYSGTLTFSNVSGWLGTCSVVLCPANSVASGSICVCNSGYSGTIAWASLNASWTGYCNPALYSFTSYTFTPCGATSRTGPTLAQCQTAYAGAAFLASYFSISGSGVQLWTVPRTGTYSVTLAGARGGGTTNYGRGVILTTNITLVLNQQLSIVIGQSGIVGTANAYTGGGGGGTYIVSGTTPLAIAGGGGGEGDYGIYSSGNQNGLFSFTQGSTGSGAASTFAASGGGFTGNGNAFTYGSNTAQGISFLNGALGGTGGSASGYSGGAQGGFGGGAGCCACSTGGGGGGGGYTGGCGGGCGASYYTGQGGASYWTGSAVNGGLNNAQGYATITFLF